MGTIEGNTRVSPVLILYDKSSSFEMKLCNIILAFHVVLVTVGYATCRPHEDNNTTPASTGQKKKTRSSRKLRVLNKILRRLTPDDVMELLRNKRRRKPNNTYRRVTISRDHHNQEQSYMLLPDHGKIISINFLFVYS